jgi:F0F1-type ATP synthase membrane subunit b/b'
MANTDGEPGSAAFYLGRGAKIDSVKITGNVAGRDVHIGVSAGEAEAVADRQQLLELLARLQQEVEALKEAPAGLRSDALDELKKAQSAGEQKDDDRLVEKLSTAQGFLERIATALPAAVSVAQAVATLVQRVPGLS